MEGFCSSWQMPVEANAQTRILVVDDHEPFRCFVCSTLQGQENLQVVGETQDGLQAVHQAEALQPDMILLDIGLPGLNGIEAARRIGRVAPNARIIFLTQESSPEIVRAALDLGAWGYVIKVQAASELLVALRAVSRGIRFVSSGLNGRGNADTA